MSDLTDNIFGAATFVDQTAEIRVSHLTQLFAWNHGL